MEFDHPGERSPEKYFWLEVIFEDPEQNSCGTITSYDTLANY